jgi:hypothetical protein
MNKWKILSVILLAVVMRAKGAAYTNTTYSATNIDYMLSTNRAYVSNVTWAAATTYSTSNTTYMVSNLQFMTFSNTVTTNFAVLTPGSNVMWLRITNGFTRDITNAAP